MATKTKTKAETKPKISVAASAKVATLIKTVVDATAKAGAAFVRLALGVREEAEKHGYDESQTREMVILSYREAMDAPQDEKGLASFDLKYRPDVSKVLRLAFPVNEKASANLRQAVAHNEKANGDRVGVNNLLEIARGNTTFANVIEHKRKKKAGGTKSYGPNQFSDDLEAIVKRAQKSGMTQKAVETTANTVIADVFNEEEEATEEKE